jgi:signal transduction histidine kinase
MSLPGTQTGELPDIMRQLVCDLARSLALEVDLVVSGTPVPLEPTVDRALQRVAQGALLNVARQAKAKMALVSLNYPSDHVDLAVQDDGIGAPDLLLQNYAESGTHFGLKSMRRQVEGLGGTFTVSDGEEGGLVVRVRVPARRT